MRCITSARPLSQRSASRSWCAAVCAGTAGDKLEATNEWNGCSSQIGTLVMKHRLFTICFMPGGATPATEDFYVLSFRPKTFVGAEGPAFRRQTADPRL